MNQRSDEWQEIWRQSQVKAFDELRAETRRNSDDLLIIKTKAGIYGSIFGMAGGVIGTVLGGTVMKALHL